MAAITVRIPQPLRKMTDGQDEVALNGVSVNDILQDLNSKFPGVKERLFDESGDLRKFVNVYLNNEDIRFLKNLDTQINDGDELSILPAIAGGR